ncbi:MAG TPA: hypothetical protein VMT96_00035 [Candidatus Bathyarchaeia archaeon]|nr:hypothetical protein [Candidatus Bathyarchaeia archaeon]
MTERHHDFEHLSSDNTEITLLRSELEELFKTHANKTVIWQPTFDMETPEFVDMHQPAEILLGGTCDLGESILNIHVRQRLTADNGFDYLILVGEPGTYSWNQITDKGAWSVHDGEQPLKLDDVEAIRLVIHDEIAKWTIEDAEKWSDISALYTHADVRAERGL